MIIVGIDLGYRNNGICIAEVLPNGLDVTLIKCDKNDLINTLDQMTSEKCLFLVEQQRFKNKYLEGLVSGFFLGKRYDYKIVAPFTKGLKIKTHYKRKKYSVDLLKNSVKGGCLIDDKKRKLDDIADAYNITMKYLSDEGFDVKLLDIKIINK